MTKTKPTSKNFAVPAATLFACAMFVMAAPAARADDYCISNGAQAAHGCGYPTMEACQAASAGIGGSCSHNGPSKSTSDSLAYQPKQQRSRKQPAATH